MFSSKKNVVGFKKPFGKNFIEFEDAPNKLCELGYMSKAQVSISPDMKPEVFCFTSLGYWEPANGKRFYFEVTVISRGIRGTIAIGLSKNEKNSADKQPGWAQGTFGFHGDDGIAFCDDAQAIRGFGPKWAAKGATVGCGVDFEAQSIFFVFPDGTKKTLPTYKMQAFPERFYPMVGMHSPMENVKVNFGTKGIPFVHNPFAEFKIPTFFKFNKKTNAILEGNTLTISAPKRESLQADSFFPRLNTVLPYYEVTILSLQPNDTFSIGFSDQRFESTELVGSMQNSFGYFNNGTVGYNFASDGERGAFKQNDVVGCGVAFDSYNQRKVFYTLNGKIVGYITKRVVAGMDCFPTLGFFGDNIRVRYNFGSAEFVWNVNEWPKPDKTCHISTLPTETLRIILEQASDDVAVTLLVIALVNKQFNKLVSDNNNIWHKLYMQRYPDQNPNLKMQSWAKFFKVRYDMIKERPSDSPIENCEFGYKCPLSLYQLGDAGDGADKRHCNKCDKDVYVVHSKDQLKQYIKLGRCVAFVSPVDNIDIEEMGEEPYYAEEE